LVFKTDPELNSEYMEKLTNKEEYRKGVMTKTIHNYFEDSYKNVVLFFAKEEKISVDELKEIIKIIENKK
jgi:BlaI family penicillinase repressor